MPITELQSFLQFKLGLRFELHLGHAYITLLCHAYKGLVMGMPMELYKISTNNIQKAGKWEDLGHIGL
jgi:hypothetical protein